MLDKVSLHLKARIQQFPSSDKIIFNNKLIEVDKNNFEIISDNFPSKSIAFIDGGQAEVISAGNFCLSLIRVGALIYFNNQKIKDYKHEFYLLTTAKYEDEEVVYESKIFSLGNETLINEDDLSISSTDTTIRVGMERASISQISNIARRFAELSLCSKVDADIIILDGILEPSFRNEEKYLSKLPVNACTLAKTSSLFTVTGNSPVVLLNRISPSGCWSYTVENNTCFVKLHPRSRHIFRFTGNRNVLPSLMENSKDAVFLGYPYGLIAVDKFVRVSNEEKKSLRMNILLKAENKDIAEYLSTINAHDILDSI